MHRAIVLGFAALGVALSVFTLGVAREGPGYGFAGDSTVAAASLLAAGWALIGSGLVFWWRRPDSRFGPLLAAGGVAWFVPELNNPGVGSALAFTAGLTLAAATPALVGHAVLAYPAGRLASAAARGTVTLAYAGAVGVLGVLPALLFDPRAQRCNQCPDNLVGVADRASTADDLRRAGVYLGVVWASLLAALCVRRLVRASPVVRPVFGTGAVYLVLAAATFAVSLDRGLVSTGTLERRLWLGQAFALTALALAVAWGWVRARRARLSVARLVVDLAQSPPPGGLRDALAGIVGDPNLVLAYPLADSGRLVDAQGRAVELPAGRDVTSLAREDRAVAVLGHARGLLDDEQLVDEVTAAARLALENERLQAEVRARLEELRASRARIVEAGDAERRRLERDLHDGAQQRLVALSLSLQLLRLHAPADPRLDEAATELQRATAELRELAHGLFPVVLADEGLAAAVEALAEDSRVPIRIDTLPEGRDAAPVETAAYTIVAEAARASRALAVRAERTEGMLVVEVVTRDLDDAVDLLELEDRVGSVDGRLAVDRGTNGRVTIRAELPCAS